MTLQNITYGSVCSGIEAASVAWHPLGWQAAWLAEIEPFPARVLHHHFGSGRPHFMPDPNEPDLSDDDRKDRQAALKAVSDLPLVELRESAPPNLGDMTKIAAMVRSGAVEAPDVLVGGTPCQAFSIAGLRGSLDDARGQLSLSYVDLANAIDAARHVRGQPACITVWENVPGVLSTKDNAFGCFLGALAGEDVPLVAPGGRWSNAGCVFGPQRTVAWRVMDAQYFGVAQRRRRVFVVSSAREGFDPTEVLFERDGVRRDIAPSRGTGKEVAGTLASRTDGGGFPGTDEACSGYLQPVDIAATLTSALGRRCGLPECGSADGMLQPVAFGGNDTRGSIDVATACMAHGRKLDFESETFLVQPIAGTLQSNGKAAGSATQQDAESGLLVATPLTPICAARQTSFGSYVDDGTSFGSYVDDGTSFGSYVDDGTSSTLKMRDYKDATDLIAYGTPGLIGAFKGGQGAKAGGIGFDAELSPTLSAADSGSNRAPVVAFNALGSYRTAGDGAVYDSGDKVAALTTGTDPCANILAFRACGQDGFTPSDVSPPVLSSDGGGAGVPTTLAPIGWTEELTASVDVMGTIQRGGAGGRHDGVMTQSMAVRRLTPRECERLQAFPDDYTLIPGTSKRIRQEKLDQDYIKYLARGGVLSYEQCCNAAADGPRYKALGNSMCVFNMSFIGRRIDTAIQTLTLGD